MQGTKLFQKIQKAKAGNEIAREWIINRHKPYIINVVSLICKRFISWSDDEASLGLSAFNRAIDHYEADKGTKFLSYAYCLINRELINHFRRLDRQNQPLSLDYVEGHGNTLTDIEIEKSIQQYHNRVESTELVEEILELNHDLGKYGIQFEELEAVSPKHRDSREMLHKMAYNFINHKDLIDDLIIKKRFPTTAFVKKCGYKIKTVEKHRKYLIAIIIIFLHPQWAHLSSCIKSREERRG